MKKPITKEKALERLAGLCSRSEQCEADLVRKLYNWGITQSEQKEILDHLKEHRYLDESRFARSFVNDKARFSHWGPYKIKMELIRKKVSSKLISEAIKDVDPEVWKEGLLKVAAAKARTLDLFGEEGYDNRQKLFRYIVSRGFPSSPASKAVNLMKKKQEEGL